MTTPTPSEVRNASHAVAHLSAMLRKDNPPSEKEWAHLRSLFTADAIFSVSDWLIEVAKKLEAREQAA
ncbi:hypothetical protein [Pseudorhodoplanes sp.]|uniref:hypothetical protein n=1 Tax=Pseudorhodoplanes sp. TaxID=1934341 RepID=UPI002CB0C16D|nr:hypothetical protein [Pseudorhodoplanes sp.]HWV44089.1 hypothetical protein [Pseudorhodoplanes sp.]